MESGINNTKEENLKKFSMKVFRYWTFPFIFFFLPCLVCLMILQFARLVLVMRNNIFIVIYSDVICVLQYYTVLIWLLRGIYITPVSSHQSCLMLGLNNIKCDKCLLPTLHPPSIINILRQQQNKRIKLAPDQHSQDHWTYHNIYWLHSSLIFIIESIVLNDHNIGYSNSDSPSSSKFHHLALLFLLVALVLSSSNFHHWPLLAQCCIRVTQRV